MKLPPALTDQFGRFVKKRLAHSVFFIGNGEAVRLDLGEVGPGSPTVSQQPCPRPEDLPEALAATIKESGIAPGRRVWVMYAGLPTYVVALPKAQTEGVGEDLLRHALAYEVESLTGLDMSKRDLVWVTVGGEPDMSSYWVSIIPRGLLESLGEALRPWRSRLAGLLHPGGIPLPLSGSKMSWLRVEYWPEAVLVAYQPAQGERQVHVFPATQQGSAARALERWRKTVPAVAQEERLSSHAIVDIQERPALEFRLDQEQGLAAWLPAWAAYLTGQEGAAAPMFRPEAGPYQEIALGGGMAAAALAVCLAHFLWYGQQTRTASSHIEELRRVEAEIKTLRDDVKKRQEELDKLHREVAAVERSQERLPAVILALRRRPADLLRDLAEHRDAETIITDIESSKDEVLVRGVTLRPTDPDRMVAGLDEHLASLGWAIQTPTKRDMEYFSAGGPWEFEMVLRDGGLAGFGESAPPAQAAAAGHPCPMGANCGRNR